MMKQAKLLSQARLPDAARPPATPTRFDSAMPTLKKRSGNFLAKKSVRVELCTSPSTTTMSGLDSPSAASAMPNASRTDLPIFICQIPRDLRLAFAGDDEWPAAHQGQRTLNEDRSVPPHQNVVFRDRPEELVVNLGAGREQHAELPDRECHEEVDEPAEGHEEQDDRDATAEEEGEDEGHDDQCRTDDCGNQEV